MNFSTEKKMEYWREFVSQKQFHAQGMTAKRLEKVLPFVLADKAFWDDVLLRHGGSERTPTEMKGESPETFDHCIGNMMGMVLQIMIEQRILKT